MDGRLGGGLVEALPEGLAVDGDELPGRDFMQRRHPTEQAALELGGLDRLEDGVEAVMRGDAVPQVEEPGQPGPLRSCPCGDGDEVIGPGEHGAQGDGDDVDERMGDLAAARVGEAGEVVGDPGGKLVGHGSGTPRALRLLVAGPVASITENHHASIIPN